jgi:hypothetical protein
LSLQQLSLKYNIAVFFERNRNSKNVISLLLHVAAGYNGLPEFNIFFGFD